MKKQMTNLRSYLEGVYAPVQEQLTEYNLPIVGELPIELSGVFVQNNPNPQFEPPGAYHWFDGDGMIHGVHIEAGRATYRNRFVRTAAYEYEAQAGGPRYTGLLNPIDHALPEGPDKNTANTDLIWHGGQMLALWWLGGVPYSVTVPDLETRGAETFGGQLPCGVAAHSKVDPRTGELVFFDFSMYQAPFLQYGLVSSDRALIHHTVIDVGGPRFFHDIAFTENYAVFLDLPMSWDLKAMDHGRRRIRFDADTPGRFGLLSRRAQGHEIRWFEVNPCYVYHTVNAWEETNAAGQPCVVVTGCRIDNPIPTRPHHEEPTVPRLYFLRMDPYFFRWTFNLETGGVEERRLDDVPTEFPRMNDDWLGMKSRYGYHQRLAREETLLFDGVIKYDNDGTGATHYEYGDTCVGGETVFVPRPGSIVEDDGYIATFVTDRGANTSELRFVDASTMTLAARIPLPHRVPFGFHAHWVPLDQEKAS
ncbi:MAG: carotenoid oxygenase family protein [Myxococcota bacterium]|nr:carotenoid oxygenase family protein [Myxococcota bacterium]